MNSKIVYRTGLSAAAALVVAGVASPSRADWKIVSEVVVSRSSSDSTTDTRSTALVPSSPETASTPPKMVTICYQGQRARIEAADGTVTLYDRALDTVYTLHPAGKSYSVATIKQMLQQGPSLASQ